MSNALKDKVVKILKANLYMTISVASHSGEPWIANLYCVYDKNYNFYWYSPKDSIHSQRIKENPSVALAIFDSRAKGNEVDAVYIKAKAYEVKSKKELLKGLFHYASKLVKTKFANKQNADKFIKQYKDFE